MSVLTDFFTSLANKIRSKTGSNESLTPSEMIDAIDDIVTPLQTKTITASTSATTVTPDTGYALNSVTVNPTPSQTKSATPSTSAQTISPDSGKLLSSVSVAAISPARSQGTSATGSGIDSTGPWVYFPYGWWPQYGSTGNAYTYMTTAQAQAAHPHSGTYTFAANDTGGTKDLGTTHNYRYVNATNVYNKGKTDGASSVTNNCYLMVKAGSNVSKTAKLKSGTYSYTIYYHLENVANPISLTVKNGNTTLINKSKTSVNNDKETGSFTLSADATITMTGTAPGNSYFMIGIG